MMDRKPLTLQKTPESWIKKANHSSIPPIVHRGGNISTNLNNSHTRHSLGNRLETLVDTLFSHRRTTTRINDENNRPKLASDRIDQISNRSQHTNKESTKHFFESAPQLNKDIVLHCEPLHSVGNITMASGISVDLKKPIIAPPPKPTKTGTMSPVKEESNSSRNIDRDATHLSAPNNNVSASVAHMLPFSNTTQLTSIAGGDCNGTGNNLIRTLELHGHVGFDALPHQLVKKAVDQGFQFNVLCVGETGIGKTTLIESLFNMKLEFEPCNHELKTVELRTKTYEVAEGGVQLKLTIVETAGFGDQLDKDKSAKVIGDFISEQFENYLKEELKIKRCLELYDDSRIHVCLYFISPTGHGLKAIDVVTMRELSKRVNVIPVIAKSDTACKDELVRFKTKILSELKSQNINIYQFPTDDETVRVANTELNKFLPFAVVGSTDFVKKENGKMVRARRYPWGMVEVENEEHCDFVKLREAMLRMNVDALRERTHTVLYEQYRRERLREMGVRDGDTGPKMVEASKQRQKETNDEMAKREVTMRDEFVARVSKKEDELKEREMILNHREKEITKRFETEKRKLDDEYNALSEEKDRLMQKVLDKSSILVNGKKKK